MSEKKVVPGDSRRRTFLKSALAALAFFACVSIATGWTTPGSM